MKLDLDSVLCARCGVSLLPSSGGPLLADTPDRMHGVKLTRSEHRVFLLLCNGLSNKQIADRLVISENTVRFHLKQVYGKLGVRSRAHAVALGRHASLDAPILARAS